MMHKIRSSKLYQMIFSVQVLRLHHRTKMLSKHNQMDQDLLSNNTVIFMLIKSPLMNSIIKTNWFNQLSL